MITNIVVDTSYLLEFFRVPIRSEEAYFDPIKNKFITAEKNKSRLYFTIPVLFELANHIAHVVDGNARTKLANNFCKTIADGTNDEYVFINIVPCTQYAIANEFSHNLQNFTQHFAKDFVHQKLGFTDAAIVLEAERLKNDRNNVHIWTLDNSLKAYEPDNEADPFVGNQKRVYWG